MDGWGAVKKLKYSNQVYVYVNCMYLYFGVLRWLLLLLALLFEAYLVSVCV